MRSAYIVTFNPFLAQKYALIKPIIPDPKIDTFLFYGQTLQANYATSAPQPVDIEIPAPPCP